jgi:RHS repeat-associated protein
VESPFRLLGQVYDEESGLSWTRFRCFDAETGRWLSADPLGIQGGIDVFAFNGAPTFLVDSLGLTGNTHQGSAPSGPSTAEEPEVKAFVEKFKKRYPGRQFQSGHERQHSDGRRLEIDFETDNAIIEFKKGRGTGLTRQVKDRTDAGVNPDGKVCIGMACSPKGMSQFVKKDVESVGGLGASESDTDAILDILAP